FWRSKPFRFRSGAVIPSGPAVRPVGGGVAPNFSARLPLPGFPYSGVYGDTPAPGDSTGAKLAPGWACSPNLPLCLPFSTGAIPGANDAEGHPEALARAAPLSLPPSVGGGTLFQCVAYC